MPGVVYGLPELFGPEIAAAQLVANPGCYPTSAILPMAPLLRAGLVEPRGLIFDSKSGVSGAGRKPTPITHYPECNESIRAYAVGQHRHTPEIEQILGLAAEASIEAIFTPHLVPMDRGILTVGYALPRGDVSALEVLDAIRSQYAACPFVRVVDDLPGTKDVSGTNYCDITARRVRDRILTISCIDNLVKGASGAAVQNFNLMFGLPETMALM
jgi:N-acetyl-gamma-glutamyl-phosphate reductase